MQIAVEVENVDPAAVVGRRACLVGLFARPVFLLDEFFEGRLRQKCLTHDASHVFQAIVELAYIEVAAFR